MNLIDFLKEISGATADTIFTVLTTLFVFGMGVLTNWIVNLLKEKNARKNYRLTINLHLYNLSQICKKQYFLTIKALDSYSLLTNKSIGVQLHNYAPIYFLSEMDYSLFLKNYISGCGKHKALKAKASVKVFNIIGYTKTFETEIVENIKYFFQLLRPHEETYIKNIFQIEEFARNLPLQEFTDYDCKKQCGEIFDNWNKLRQDNHFVTSYTHLISPLKRLFDKYSLEPSASNLINSINECHQRYSDIVHLDKNIIEFLKRFAYENRKVYRELQVVLKVFGYKPFYKHANIK